jgi:prepilin-type N-terminal cleavage/methylation domain-containing protein
MKLLSGNYQRGRAFTLVELLVVMGIIAILAGVVVVSVGAAIRYAKRTKTNAVAAQLQTAVQNYYVEYGVYPTQPGYPSAAGDAYYDGNAPGGWVDLMEALSGNISLINPGAAVTPAVPNTRSIQFLTPARSDLDTTYGIPVNPFGKSGTSGSSYLYMAIDTDYSGLVGDTGNAAGKLPDFNHYNTNYTGATLANGTPGGVAVWCPCDQPLAGGTAAAPSPASFWAHTY